MPATSPPAAQTPAKLYRDLLAIVYKRLAEEWGVPRTARSATPMAGRCGDWPAFRRSAGGAAVPQEALQARHPLECRQRDLRAQQRRSCGVDVRRDLHGRGHRLLQAEPRNFDYMLEQARDLGVDARSEILHTAESLFHDHEPAN